MANSSMVIGSRLFSCQALRESNRDAACSRRHRVRAGPQCVPSMSKAMLDEHHARVILVASDERG